MPLIYKHTARETPAGQDNRVRPDLAEPAAAPRPAAEPHRHFLMPRGGDGFCLIIDGEHAAGVYFIVPQKERFSKPLKGLVLFLFI